MAATLAFRASLPFGAVTTGDAVTWPVDAGAPPAQRFVFFGLAAVLLLAIAWLSRRQVRGLVLVQRTVPLWTVVPVLATPAIVAVTTTGWLGCAVTLLIAGASLPSWWLVVADGSSALRVIGRLVAGVTLLTPPYVAVIALAVPPIALLHLLTPRNYPMMLLVYGLPTAGLVVSYGVAVTVVAAAAPRTPE